MKRRLVNSIGFADYVIIVADITKYLQNIIEKFEEYMKENGMTVTWKKINVLRLNNTENMKVVAKEEKTQEVKENGYVESVLIAY